jgi:putative undecaprenyl diphosphate synthase
MSERNAILPRVWPSSWRKRLVVEWRPSHSLAPVAQWIEHRPSKPRVAGSSPAGREPFLNRGASPLGLPYTRARGDPRRPAPRAWLASLVRAAPWRHAEGRPTNFTIQSSLCRLDERPEEASFRRSLCEAIHAPSGTRDVDLLIRTGGEQRLSDFLLWESAYAELYFTDVPWPEFSEADLASAVRAFAARDRRYGGLLEAAR